MWFSDATSANDLRAIPAASESERRLILETDFQNGFFAARLPDGGAVTLNSLFERIEVKKGTFWK
jgi:hypothetical protein